MGVHHLHERLRSGERSGRLASAIADLFRPTLELQAYGDLERQLRKLPEQPRTVNDLFDARLSSVRVEDPSKLLILNDLTESEFLVSMANALDAVVMRGLVTARGIGATPTGPFLRRVYHESGSARSAERGMAPSVTLLHAVVGRLVDVNCAAARGIVSRWRDPPVHVRLRAVASRDDRIASATEAGRFLLDLDHEIFWGLYPGYPEVAELRASRFAEFDDRTQKEITRRIRQGLPRQLWDEDQETDRIEAECLHLAARELKRIQDAGGTLPAGDRVWLEANVGDPAEVDQVEEGSLAPVVRWRPSSPDRALDSQKGIERLRTLEQKLSEGDRAARDWLQESGAPLKVLQDLDSVADSGGGLPVVWGHLCQAHLPPGDQEEASTRDPASEARRVLDLMERWPGEILPGSIEAISHWLSTWRKYVVGESNWPALWFRAWPAVVDREKEPEPDQPLDFHELSTTPAAKLIGVFLDACPNLDEVPRPFDGSHDLRRVRGEAIKAPGLSGLIARQEMIQSLGYFLRADQDWTEEYLVEPLRLDGTVALELWRAVGLRRQPTDVLRSIGQDMVARTRDHRLEREIRHVLALSVMLESLSALWERREPAVAHNEVQQMIRLLDGEGRTYLVEAITQAMTDPVNQEPSPPSPEELFRSAVKPFLEGVWPQERSLATKDISAALAVLPAAARGEFAEAVATIERFLRPFDCWSMLSYGLYQGEWEKPQEECPQLSMIDDQPKAEALLKLLDRTVGTAESAVIPDDLGDALEQVRGAAPSLVDTLQFRRLETAARRRG